MPGVQPRTVHPRAETAKARGGKWSPTAVAPATGRDALAWITEGIERGAGEILLTSIDADGTQAGYDLELLAAVCARVNVPVVASGGAGSIDHLADALAAGASAVLAASIFHESTYTPDQVKRELASRGFPMRLEKKGVRR